jgi:GNAT superfamily N-acetyltransferase
VIFVERHHGTYTLSDNPQRLDIRVVHTYLRSAPWSKGIPLAILERAIANSLCLGVYSHARVQVAFVRMISDFATYCHFCDMFVLEDHRHQGLSKAMLAMALNHPRLQGVSRWSLITDDAHELYKQAGFGPIANSGRQMERLRMPMWERPADSSTNNKDDGRGYN